MNSSGKIYRIRHKERKNRRDYSQYEMYNFYFDRSLQKTEVTLLQNYCQYGAEILAITQQLEKVQILFGKHIV